MVSRLLVIGFGNTLRCDDGVGPRVADTIEEMGLPDVLTLACHQITPELAQPVSLAGAVVFVDAAVDDPRTLHVDPVEPQRSSLVLEHAPSPATLLALARDAFGHAPRAWMVSVPAEVLGFGEELSPVAQKGVRAAVQAVLGIRSRLASETQRTPSGSGTPTLPQVQVRA